MPPIWDYCSPKSWQMNGHAEWRTGWWHSTLMNSENEEGGGWNQNTVMSIIRKGTELCLLWNYNMVIESIWVFSISLSVGVTPLALLLYKCPFSLWREHIPPQLCILLEPIFVCSYRGIYTAWQQRQYSPWTRRWEGLRKSLVLPLTHTHTHFTTSAIPPFMVSRTILLLFPYGSRYWRTVANEDQCKRKKKKWKENNKKRNCQRQTTFLPLSICSPHCPYPLSSLPHPPSISFSPSFSLWWRIVIPLGSIFQASEHPFTAAITNL